MNFKISQFKTQKSTGTFNTFKSQILKLKPTKLKKGMKRKKTVNFEVKKKCTGLWSSKKKKCPFQFSKNLTEPHTTTTAWQGMCAYRNAWGWPLHKNSWTSYAWNNRIAGSGCSMDIVAVGISSLSRNGWLYVNFIQYNVGASHALAANQINC